MITKITAEGSKVLSHQWQFSLEMYGVLTRPPIVAGDRLVCFTDSLVFALDIYTGAEVSTEGGFPHYLNVSDDPPLPNHSRGTLYYVEAGELVARQLSDGSMPIQLSDKTERWKKPPVTQATSVNANENVVVVSERNPATAVKGFDATTGLPLWGPVQVSQKSPGPVAATRDAVLFVSGGHLFAVNIRSGDTRFDFSPAGDPPDPLTHDYAPQIGEVGDQTIVVTAGVAAYAVDVANGKQIWAKRATRPTRNTQWLMPAISERHNRVVLANNDGELFVVELTKGTPCWSAQVPNVKQVSIAGDKVYVNAQDGAQFYVYDLMSGTQAYVLKLDEPGHVDVVAGHGILFIAGSTNIRGIPFGDQNAALFRKSEAALITVAAEGSQFDFGQGDFTIETWVATTCGGELVSGFPATTDDEHHGFRVNVTDQGRLRFAVINKTAANSFAAVSPSTNVADGSWHHVAVVRRGDGVEMYLDGVSLAIDSARKGAAALNIGGKTSLTFGAFVPGSIAPAQAHLNGLMREVRLWDIALDSAKLQSRLGRTLIGTEPHMLGYWRMDEADISKLKNHVPRHTYTANVQRMLSFATELALDKSAFPYLLDQVNLQWPYSGHWSARGEEQVTTTAALDRSGILSFGAANMLYGVHASDGARVWGVETPDGTSAPVAANGVFYAFTGAKGLISIDAHTGAVKRVENFESLMPVSPPAGTRLSAPAIESGFIAAAAPKGDVWILEFAKPGSTAKVEPWKWKAPEEQPGDLMSAGGRVYLVAGQTLHQLDPATKKSQSVRVASKHFHAQDDIVFCVPAAGKVVALAASDLTKQKAAFNLPDGSAITGLAAAPDADLLVVATDKGVLYGLTYATLATRWTRTIPAGKASSKNALNVPTISGRTVFCTSASGTVAAIDARTGEFHGLFFEPISITTAPTVDAGTVYFGCADAPPEALLTDGALHSVVFGSTHALRLGLDQNGATETAHGYAVVTAGDVLELMGVDSCCVEAWVNTREGGEVLSICPGAKSRYGLRLWLERNGAIHFTCTDLPEDSAGHLQKVTSVSAASIACDGRWHHIAISRSGRKEVTVYLDGVPANATTKFEEVAAPALVEGLKVFIGADATASAPANFFAGMIGEIRVWDTYLAATRIAERMHNKLIGNEPDLLAYWNFDALSIHDGSRNGHEGKLEKGSGSSGFWLADLNFTHPSYPFLETEGRLKQEGEEGGSGPLADTIFELVVTARRADGGILGGHDVTLWYVRHPGETGPASIKVTSPKGITTIQAVGPDHGDEQSVTTTTGSNGKVTFRLTTQQRGHGPAIDLRAAFLPANERYHVSVLIDTQKLEKPVPPHLEAQAKLIQDYHWQTGDHWDAGSDDKHANRDRATWRTVITARNADGTARPGERLQLWSHDHVEVEVDGTKYPINPNNYQSFVADDSGELTVVLSATDLQVPALSVWAGFMHRDERYTIPLDQEANKKLAEVKSTDLSEPQRTSWKPGYDPKTDNKPVVKPGYAPHAEKVATAIRHVMSVSQEPKPKVRITERSKRAAELMARRNFSDMRQAAPTPRGDGVRTLRTLRHINRHAPVDGDSFRQSLDKVPEFKGSIGFMFQKGAAGPELHPIKSLQHLQAEFPRAFAPPVQEQPIVGNIFEDAWNAIESAAEAAWREAQKIAIYIADQVTLVIDYANQTIKKVVNSVKEAVEAVVHIIKMIEALIEDVIRILMLLFDWSGILETQKILKTISQNQLKIIKEMTSTGQKDKFQNLITGVFKTSTGPIDVSTHQAGQVSANSSREQHNDPRVLAEVNSVHGKYVDSKMDEHKEQITVNGKAAVEPAKTQVDEAREGRVLKLAESLGGVLNNPLGTGFGEIYDGIKDLVSGDISKFGSEFSQVLLQNFNVLGDVVTGIDVVLNAEADIPFLSQLYKWITRGNTLTLLDVICLGLAIPTHVGYGIFTRIACGEVRRFPDDAKGLVQLQTSLGERWGMSLADAGVSNSLVVSDGNLSSRQHDLALHWCYFAFNMLYVFGAGALKGMQVSRPIGWRLDKTLKVGGPIFIAEGLVAKSLIFTAGQKEGGWNDLELAWNSTVFSVLVCLDLYTCYDLLLGVETGQFTTTSRVVQEIKYIASFVGCVLLVIRLDAWIEHRSDVAPLFHVRGLLESLTMMMTFDDTPYFIYRAGVETAELFVTGETILKLITGGVHIAGIIAELPSTIGGLEQPA